MLASAHSLLPPGRYLEGQSVSRMAVNGEEGVTTPHHPGLGQGATLQACCRAQSGGPQALLGPCRARGCPPRLAPYFLPSRTGYSESAVSL